jgi:hypothetical protein
MSPRDYVFIAYIALWILLILWVNRWPVPFGMTPIGMILSLFAGAAVGWILPHTIADYMREGLGYSTVSEKLSGFGRLAQFVGFFAGPYVAFRGAVIWMLVLSGGLVLGIVLNVVVFVFR